MKKSVLFVMMISLFCPAVVFAGQFGPVRPTADLGQISQTIGYFLSRGDWVADKSGFEDGVVTQNQFYIQAGYGVGTDSELYVRLGGSDLEFEDAFAIDDADMDDGIKPFVTLGAKGLFYRGVYFDVGAFIQASYYAGYEDSNKVEILPGETVKEELELTNYWDANVGIVFQGNYNGWSFYGGPIYYLSQATLEAESTLLSTGLQESNSSDYEERDDYGLVGGVEVPLFGYGSVNLEGQYKNRISAGGAFIYLRTVR